MRAVLVHCRPRRLVVISQATSLSAELASSIFDEIGILIVTSVGESVRKGIFQPLLDEV